MLSIVVAALLINVGVDAADAASSTCKDLNIHPGDALKGCQTICESTTDVVVVDKVGYIYDSEKETNKNQTFFTVGCSCGKDGDDEQHQCGPDSILYRDPSDVPLCSSGIPTDDQGTIIIGNGDQCFEYCIVSSIWIEEKKSCSCYNSVGDDEIEMTMACDDSQAHLDPCHGIGGVDEMDCRESMSSSTTSSSMTSMGGHHFVKQMMVSSAAIMGIWLLQW